jgi:large subunit ribosomal protein L21
MQAIIETGGKQYKVSPGSIIWIEKINGEAGTTVVFDRVLCTFDDGNVVIGTPTLQDVKVSGKIIEHGKGPKIRGFKYKSKANYRRRYGHRQPFTRVEITSIE